ARRQSQGADRCGRTTDSDSPRPGRRNRTVSKGALQSRPASRRAVPSGCVLPSLLIVVTDTTVIARSAANEAIHCATRRDGLLRGACHRAALRADPLARNDGLSAILLEQRAANQESKGR